MDEAKARRILGTAIQPDGGLYLNRSRYALSGGYLHWPAGLYEITLDGDYGVDFLEAVAWWMRNCPVPFEKDDE